MGSSRFKPLREKKATSVTSIAVSIRKRLGFGSCPCLWLYEDGYHNLWLSCFFGNNRNNHPLSSYDLGYRLGARLLTKIAMAVSSLRTCTEMVDPILCHRLTITCLKCWSFGVQSYPLVIFHSYISLPEGNDWSSWGHRNTWTEKSLQFECECFQGFNCSHATNVICTCIMDPYITIHNLPCCIPYYIPCMERIHSYEIFNPSFSTPTQKIAHPYCWGSFYWTPAELTLINYVTHSYTLQCIILHYITMHGITSHHVTSRHVTSLHVTSRHFTSHTYTCRCLYTCMHACMHALMHT